MARITRAMRARCLVLPLVLAITGATQNASAAEPRTERAIEHALKQYVRAKYEGDDEAVRARAHHDIARRAVSDTYWGQPSDEWVRPYTHDHLQFYGTAYNQTRRDDPSEGRCEIEVYEIRGNVAAVKMTATVWFDYFHMMRVNGEWHIVNIMFEGLPEDRWVGVPDRGNG